MTNTPDVGRTHLVLPAVLGARYSAAVIAADLPDDLTGQSLTLDASLAVSATEEFIDELIDQVFEMRHAGSFAVVGASSRMSVQLHRAAALRGFSGQLSVHVRAG
jgi:hypothetical protein